MMQRKLAEQVRRRFNERIARVHPTFALVKGEAIPPGCRLYRSQFGDITAFLLLLMTAKSRGFTFVDFLKEISSRAGDR